MGRRSDSIFLLLKAWRAVSHLGERHRRVLSRAPRSLRSVNKFSGADSHAVVYLRFACPHANNNCPIILYRKNPALQCHGREVVFDLRRR